MRFLRRNAPARIASPLPIKLTVPGSGVVATAPQLLLMLLFSVTAPFCAKALPQLMVAPLFRLMLVSARIFPTNAVVVPRDAELPTCQNTFGELKLLVKIIDEALAVVRVLPI